MEQRRKVIKNIFDKYIIINNNNSISQKEGKIKF